MNKTPSPKLPVTPTEPPTSQAPPPEPSVNEAEITPAKQPERGGALQSATPAPKSPAGTGPYRLAGENETSWQRERSAPGRPCISIVRDGKPGEGVLVPILTCNPYDHNLTTEQWNAIVAALNAW